MVGRAAAIAITAETASPAPALIDAPPEWIDRLVGVLMDNACRYAGTGGQVRIGAHRSGGGAGLGLAIADSIVRSTGGRWRIAGSPLGGALFEVSWRHAQPRRLTGQRAPGDK